MRTPTLLSWFKARRSAATPTRDRSALRIGIPRVLSVWSTHQFWIGFLTHLGVAPRNIVFSSETSEQQFRQFGHARATVDACYPVKCASGHYGELLFGQKHRLDLVIHPMHSTVPSFLRGHVLDTLACPRDLCAAENIKAGFVKERDLFQQSGIIRVTPFVSLAEPDVAPRQLYTALKDVLDLDEDEVEPAVAAGYAALDAFNDKMRKKSREILAWCAREQKPCILVLARAYHMDPGIGHDIESNLQMHGIPILWTHYLPIDDDLMEWLFGEEIARGDIRSAFDISDVWPFSFSNSTNEIMWSAKVAARMPWITCVIRLSSYECGLDQPTFTPTQRVVEASGTLYFKFGDLDATKPTGSVKIRTETILYYLDQYSPRILRDKLSRLPAACPLIGVASLQTQPSSAAGIGVPQTTT
jgi:predicted nucleotide-binding protein (sugar kinase/HSP70/actin superfamily)